MQTREIIISEATFIHHTAVLGDNVIIGKGCYIGPYCLIGLPAEHKGFWPAAGRVVIGDNCVITGHVTIDAGTTEDTVLGNNVWMLKHSHVGHDAKIGDGTVISCGAKVGGHAIIEADCNLGLNSAIHQRQYIRQGCMIGANAFVSKTLVTEPFQKYAGVPAKHIGANFKP